MAASSQAASSSATAAAVSSGTGSTIGQTIVGSYLFKIDGFSATKDLGVGKSIKSGTFSVGGHDWYIKCYPCGEKWAGCVTLQLCLDHPWPVQAGCVFTMKEENAADLKDDFVFLFSEAHEAYGFSFIRREDLESRLKEKDDCFEVRCDVSVVKKMKTESTAAPWAWPGLVGTEAMAGSYVLTLEGYSKTLGGVGNGECIESHRFDIGGPSWYIKFYPHGEKGEGPNDGVPAYLCINEALYDNEEVKVRYEMSLLTDAGQIISSIRDFCTFSETYFENGSCFLPGMGHGSLPFLQNTFHIMCDMAVLEEITAVPAPLPIHHRRIGDLQGSQQIEGDVTFDVGDHLFTAHKYVLATRSTAFMAGFFGPAGKENAAADVHTRVRIDDMEPRVFKSLLHFIYTDTLPDEVVHGDDSKVVMAQGLLVAADRYVLERLKLICSDMLCSCINDARTAVTSLNLADKHGCVRLKEACIKFLMDQFDKD